MDRFAPARIGSSRDALEAPHTHVHVVPFGPLGGGQWTAHPIGLLIVFGFVLLALVGVPESRLFFLLSLGLGAFLGSGLYLWHRRKASSEHLSHNNFCIR